MSATEVAGSNGTRFAADSGVRTTITIGSGVVYTSASDPDVFFDGRQFVLYVSHGASVSVWTSPTLAGSYTMSTTLPNGLLSSNFGGVPAGYFDGATSQYWTFTHSSSGGTSVIRRAVHGGFVTLTSGGWSTVMTGSGLGLGSTISVESPGVAVLTAGGAPTPAASLAATVSGSSVTLAWTAGDGATSYDVEVGSQSGASDLTTLSTTSPSLVGNASSGTYYVRVRSNPSGRPTAGASSSARRRATACPTCIGKRPTGREPSSD